MSKIKKYLAALLTLALMASACAAGISMTVSAAPGDYPSADEIYEDVNHLKEVYSPNGELFMSFWLSSAGEAYYEVVYNGIRVVENSKLGLRLDYGTLDSGFELLSTATAANNTSWNDPLNQLAVIPDKRHCSDCEPENHLHPDHDERQGRNLHLQGRKRNRYGKAILCRQHTL